MRSWKELKDFNRILVQGAETTSPPNPKAEGVKMTLPPSEVSAPPHKEQEVVAAPLRVPPVPNKVIASCSLYIL